jgi:hypothetical protein
MLPPSGDEWRVRNSHQVFRKKLQRDVTAEFKVLGFVHHAHPAAELFDDPVMRDGLVGVAPAFCTRMLVGSRR